MPPELRTSPAQLSAPPTVELVFSARRMGADPEQSVVDRWGRCHDVANLHIFDGSVFPTAAAVNPTSTICALSLRFAEQLYGQRRMRSALSATDRATFRAIVDVLLPGCATLPAGNSVGVAASAMSHLRATDQEAWSAIRLEALGAY
jgi:GMC oxidoreductase